MWRVKNMKIEARNKFLLPNNLKALFVASSSSDVGRGAMDTQGRAFMMQLKPPANLFGA